LTAQAEQLRNQRVQELRAKIGKLATTMIVPIGAFIIPSIMLLIIGPMVPTLFHSLGGL
jgi:pilus assembly protein TadC